MRKSFKIRGNGILMDNACDKLWNICIFIGKYLKVFTS